MRPSVGVDPRRQWGQRSDIGVDQRWVQNSGVEFLEPVSDNGGRWSKRSDIGYACQKQVSDDDVGN